MNKMIMGLLALALPMIGNADTRDVQSLDGSWTIVFDQANEGREAKWHTQEIFEELEKREITVPSCWEEIEQDYEGVATYGKLFPIAFSCGGK